MEIKSNTFLLLIFWFSVSSVVSIGNLLLSSGPSCTVSTLIPGTPNQSVQSMKGTCYSSLICRQQGGVPIGRCGVSNVCCVFPRTCGGIAANNSTYFTNPGFPSSYNNSNTCLLTIHRIPGVQRICQIRLDFMDFELVQPTKGECDPDYFQVNGQNLNSIVPKICGFNSGQHLYVDVDGALGPINLVVRTSGSGQRRWNILVSQIECNNPSKAPPNCLQYFIGPDGYIASFNYEVLQQTNLNEVNPKPDQLGDLRYRGVGYMNNLDYSICFRKQQYFCTQTYSINNSSSGSGLNDQAFSIASKPVGKDVAGVGALKCPNDYLLLNGIRYCGYRLNTKALSEENISTNEPVTDEGTGPFIARFVSDKQGNEESKRGFKLDFKQNPCVTVLQYNTQSGQTSEAKAQLYQFVNKPAAQELKATTLSVHIIGTLD